MLVEYRDSVLLNCVERANMNLIKQIQDKLNNKSQLWFDNLCKIVEFLSGIAALISLVSGIFREKNDMFMFISIHWSGIIFFFLMGLFIVLTLKYRSSAIGKMKAASIETEIIIEKTLRCMHDMRLIESRIDDSNNDSICGQCDSLRTEFVHQITRIYVGYAVMMLDHLQASMKKFIAYDVSYCIKVIIDSKKATVCTLARSSNTDPERLINGNSEIIISENSDFEFLNNANSMSIYKPYFYENDLNDYNERLREATNGTMEYKNSNPRWRDFYIATMVVPISKVSGPNEEGIVTYGFLCADAKDERAFDQRQKTINIKIMQTYAALFGMVSSQYNQMMKKL